MDPDRKRRERIPGSTWGKALAWMFFIAVVAGFIYMIYVDVFA